MFRFFYTIIHVDSGKNLLYIMAFCHELSLSTQNGTISDHYHHHGHSPHLWKVLYCFLTCMNVFFFLSFCLNDLVRALTEHTFLLYQITKGCQINLNIVLVQGHNNNSIIGCYGGDQCSTFRPVLTSNVSNS